MESEKLKKRYQPAITAVLQNQLILLYDIFLYLYLEKSFFLMSLCIIFIYEYYLILAFILIFYLLFLI